jgi:DNA-binding beta-propeller fold protein YncE
VLGQLYVINVASSTQTQMLMMGSLPCDLAVNSNTDTIYVANQGGNTISVVNGDNGGVPPSQSTLTVGAQTIAGQSLVGFYMTLSQGGNAIASGFSPATFTLNDGQSYVVQAEDYGLCHFDHWADTGNAGTRTISISNNTQTIAVYDCGSAPSSN